MAIDPMITMAVAVQARKGVYALLLGSGASRSSGVPTAWEVVVDLINRIAQLHDEDAPSDPIDWYTKRIGKPPTYSDILGELAKSPADRSQLLRSYFEPSDEDTETGIKTPTKAHRAIARMVAAGHIRVILTTNFDRLMEQALAEVNVTPNVVWSPASLAGMTPMQHATCTTIKLHGDYLDLETKNTVDELSEYSPELNSLLDRVLSEYGLIVCGWSGDWDEALREAIIRSTRHRFTTFWLRKGALSDKAQRVAATRQAVEVEITGADESFLDLEEKVRSLDESGSLHPMSPEVAAATAKRYLADRRFLIRLEDLLMEEAGRVREALAGEDFAVGRPTPDEESVRQRAEKAHVVSANLSAMLRVGCFWGSADHYQVWKRALERVVSFEDNPLSFNKIWVNMRFLPAALAFHSAGIAALAAEQYATVALLLTGCVARDRHEKTPLVVRTNGWNPIRYEATKLLFPPHGHRTPGSEWIYQKLVTDMSGFVGGVARLTELFGRFELLTSMSHLHLHQSDATGSDRALPGRWLHEYDERLYMPNVFRSEIEKLQDKWQPLKAGLFDGHPARAKSLIEAIEDQWKNHIW